MANDKLSHKKDVANRRAIAAATLAKRTKEEKRRNIAMWTTLGVIVVAIVTAITLVVVTSTVKKMDVSETSPNALSSNGVILTSQTDVITGTGYNLESGKEVDSKTLLKDSKVPHIELYIDYACPHCKEFEDTNSAFLNSLLDTKKATVEYKPIIVIGSNLSISGGNAAACVAEYAPNRFNELHIKLFAQQTQPNPSVSKVVKDLNIQGDAGDKVASCVSSKVFSKWLTKATSQALTRIDALAPAKNNKMVQGTPTVIVDGVKYPYAPAQFKTFMNAMIGGGLSAEAVIKKIDSENSTPSTNSSNNETPVK